MSKIRVGAAVVDAYHFVNRRTGELVRIAWIPLLLSVGLDIAAALFTSSQPGEVVELVGLILYPFVLTLVQVPFLTAWHRVTLLSPEQYRPSVGYAFRRWEVAYACYAIMLVLILLVALVILGVMVYVLHTMGENLVSETLEGAGVSASGIVAVLVAASVVAGASLVALLLLIARFVLVFPAAAVGERVGLGKSWKLSQGNVWRIFWISVLIYLPIALLTAAEVVVAALADSDAVTELLYDIPITIVGFYFSGVWVSAMSFVFRELAEYDATSFKAD